MNSPLPTSAPGMIVDGRNTVLRLMSSPDFYKSEWVTALIPLINDSYSKSHPPYIDSSFVRMHDANEYSQDLGDAGSDGSSNKDVNDERRLPASVFVLSFAEPVETDPYPLGVIGTGACKLSLAHDSVKRLVNATEDQRRFWRPAELCTRMPGVADWELKLIVTGKQYLRQGVGEYIINAVYDEMRRRTAKADRVERGLEKAGWDTRGIIDEHLRRELYSSGGTNGTQANGNTLEQQTPRVRILLSSMYELRGKFYEKRGYSLDANIPVAAGFYNLANKDGTEPFNVCHMQRLLP